jgi:hypothetical protein
MSEGPIIVNVKKQGGSWQSTRRQFLQSSGAVTVALLTEELPQVTACGGADSGPSGVERLGRLKPGQPRLHFTAADGKRFRDNPGTGRARYDQRQRQHGHRVLFWRRTEGRAIQGARPRTTRFPGRAVLPRGQDRAELFQHVGGHTGFARCLRLACARLPRRVLISCRAPNHVHLALGLHRDGDLSRWRVEPPLLAFLDPRPLPWGMDWRAQSIVCQLRPSWSSQARALLGVRHWVRTTG